MGICQLKMNQEESQSNEKAYSKKSSGTPNENNEIIKIEGTLVTHAVPETKGENFRIIFI